MRIDTSPASESEVASLEVGRQNRSAAVSHIAAAHLLAELDAFTRDQMRLRSSAAMIARADTDPSTILELLQ